MKLKQTQISFVLAVIAMFAFSLVAFKVHNVYAAGSSRIGVVDMQRVIAMSNQGKKANSELKKMAEKYDAKLEKMRKKIASLSSDLKQNGSVMSSEEKTSKTQEFEADISNFRKEEGTVQKIMNKKRYELLQGLINKADGIVNQIAQEKGYILVLDSRAVIYGSKSIDITGEVLNRMNK